jgi:hypothetical protein
MAISRLPASSYKSVKHAIGGVNSVVNCGIVSPEEWVIIGRPDKTVSWVPVAVSVVAGVIVCVGARRNGEDWDILINCKA